MEIGIFGASGVIGVRVLDEAVSRGHRVTAFSRTESRIPAALLTALEQHPATRVIVVGGAGSLEVRPGLQVLDVEGFAEKLPETLGVPAEYVKVVLAHREALNLYRLSNRNWTYLSPSAGLIQPGERTGRFRVGGKPTPGAGRRHNRDLRRRPRRGDPRRDRTPRHIQRRYTVGY